MSNETQTLDTALITGGIGQALAKRLQARGAAATYAPQGLRINVVAPGLTETPLSAGLTRQPEMRAAAARQYPLPHAQGVQTADDVAGVIGWLLSDAAARLTGQVLPVDGGFTAIRPLVR